MHAAATGQRNTTNSSRTAVDYGHIDCPRAHLHRSVKYEIQRALFRYVMQYRGS
jgi:hypothetical protein